VPALKTQYLCQQCGTASPKWAGQCPSCGAWNTLVETAAQPRSAARVPSAARAMAGIASLTPIAVVESAEASRIATGLGEVDRVLGGGFVPGSIALFGGDPGIGKSTLLLQVAGLLAERGLPVLYVTGEESPGQVRGRAERIGAVVDGLELAATTELETALAAIEAATPALVVVDSVQTLTSGELAGPAGSVGQVREVASRLAEAAKSTGTAVALVGHVTKEGTVAGPRTLEHLVDAVIYLEGERLGATRLLRAAKNRFGSTDEVGVFEMAETGLREVADPSRAFLVEHELPAPGSVVAPTLEGSRPLLVEVQALVAPSGYGTPARRGSGIDPNRLALLVAVLGRRAGVALGSHDVYANLAGGLAVDEPGLDLPLALALASSFRDVPVDPGTVAIGEVGLLGELRGVGGLERRLREAARLGFRRAVVPRAGRSSDAVRVDGLEIVAVATLRDAIDGTLVSRAGARGGAPAADARLTARAEPIVGAGGRASVRGSD
jgi:DNA repair protein RadA/Sms